ncbi:RHS repeat-associated core domain-containing protein, partial [Rothia nasimurium]|uniref:RHS repeat-associated core domain-containing protein n=1 Tax=Rothia nasimurium TaxID=85336 RepID=UPI003C6DCFB1
MALTGVVVSGSLAVGDLEILGARVYDRQVRGFVSPDPVVSPVGAGWSANVYAFVGFAPVGLVDPWGLSPMTAGEFREYRQDSSARAWERMGGQLHRWADEHAEA